MAPTSSLPLSEPQRESLFARLLTPLTFLSFLISLLLIDTQSTLQRSSSHSSSSRQTPSTTPSSAAPSMLARIRSKIHTLIYRPSPYAYVRSPTGELHREKLGRGNDGATAEEKAGAKMGPKEVAKGEEPWHLHTQQRKIMRMEVVDAFELRKRVVVVLVLGAVSILGLGMWGLWWSVRVVMRYL